MLVQIIAVLCVVGLAIGQILFKMAAISLAQTGSFFALKTLIALGTGVTLYGITTIGWVWVLQKVEIGRIYPIMALAFILVPLGSYFVFGERFQPQYVFGVALIVVGILVALKA